MTDKEWKAHVRELERLESWMARFKTKLNGWWLATPFQDGLKSCLGALSLLLSSRLAQAYGRFQALLGIRAVAAPPPPRPVGAADERCEWVTERADELQLPTFPSFDSFNSIELPQQLPPLPRILPQIPAVLQSVVSDASSQLAKQPQPSEQSAQIQLHSGMRARGSTGGAAAVGGAAGLAFGAALIACGVLYRRRQGVGVNRRKPELQLESIGASQSCRKQCGMAGPAESSLGSV